jgi:lipid-A-disaccharide synthase
VTGAKLAQAILPLLRDTPERRAQLSALERIPEKMRIEGATPSELAARVVLERADLGRVG